MSEPRHQDAAKAAWNPQQGGGSSPLLQLTLIRFREFLREPEAVFWTFIFPLLLAGGLGLAFRSRPADIAKVGILSSAPAAGVMQATLAGDSSLQLVILDDTAAANALRIGTVGHAYSLRKIAISFGGSCEITWMRRSSRPARCEWILSTNGSASWQVGQVVFIQTRSVWPPFETRSFQATVFPVSATGSSKEGATSPVLRWNMGRKIRHVLPTDQ